MDNMSNLKRSRPDLQDSVLKKLQEISASRMESDKSNETSMSDCPSLNFDCGVKEGPNNTENVFNFIMQSDTGNERKIVEAVSPNDNDSTISPKPNIPDLIITPESEGNTSNSGSIVSSSSSSPKVSIKNQHMVKGLYALSVSNTSNFPSSLPSSPRTRMLPSFYSPKLGRRFESLPDYASASSSPTSPSRKYFRLLSSPTTLSGGMRRGSEPLLDRVSGRDLNEIQLSMTDRRWEKLRSILEAMKNEPFDVDSAIDLSSPDMLSNLKENIDTQEELIALRKELSNLHVEMELKDGKLNRALNDRNVALAYIKKLKLSDKDLDDENKNELTQKNENLQNVNGCNVYERELELLKTETSSKEDVFNMLMQVVEELRVERSYLNHLMSVVLDRAPWMLDEVDKGGHWTEIVEDEEKHLESSDDEVWC